MKRLSSALWSLSKAIASRPAKPIKPIPTKIHWTKAEKPLEEMTAEERKEFAKKLASKSIKNLESYNVKPIRLTDND